MLAFFLKIASVSPLSDGASADPISKIEIKSFLRTVQDKAYALLSEMGIESTSDTYADNVLILFIILLAAFGSGFLIKKLARKTLQKLAQRTNSRLDDLLIQRKALDKFINIIPAIIIFTLLPLAFPVEEFDYLLPLLSRLCLAYIIAVVLRFISACLGIMHEVSSNDAHKKIKPLKGMIQSAQIFIWLIGIILIVAILLKQDPTKLLAGIGASAAILMVVFKDTIMSFLAGIQLSANDMLRVGDWITMSKYGADGDVIEVNLNSVKVKNFDNTVTTIPPYALVSDSFQNWRAMSESGGRRVKRSISIDMNSVKFCDEEMLDRLRKIDILRDYIDGKERELSDYNKKHNIDSSVRVNGRRQTNLGVFRAYIEAYLKFHPQVNKNQTCMVRQLQPNEKGIPLELYFFTSDVRWIPHENIQSDVFDHIIASIPQFELHVFQNIAGYDLQSLKHKQNAQDNS